jgi:steroid 5-alpha reductase family enzyme
MPVSHIFVVNIALVILLMLILWRWAVAIRDVSFIDAFWAFGMVLVALATFTIAGGDPVRKAVIAGLTCLWGLRLGTYLFLRWRKAGVDPRYEKIIGYAMEKKGWSFSRVALQQVFALQGALLLIVCLPAQLGQVGIEPFGPIGWIGAGLALFGIAFESIGDAQLTRHRNDPAMKGKVLDTGLWRYTRHPNYFGDAVTWWGIWIVAAESAIGLWALPGPILITWLLTRLSGVPMLERALKKTRPGYEDYIRRTSSFFPLPPKKG